MVFDDGPLVDAYDLALRFVSLVGPGAALEAVRKERAGWGADEPTVTRVIAWAKNARGERARTFMVDDFTVQVEPREDDERHAEFTRRLAAIASQAVA